MPVSATYGLAFGPLISWGSFTFKSGRSILLPWQASTPDYHSDISGSPNQIDQTGYAVTSVTLVAKWQYNVHADTGQSNAHQVQDELDTLFNAWLTPNGDGTTGQVKTLTVQKLGYAGTNMTGPARLLDISAQEVRGAWQRLVLTFRLPQGLTG